MKQILIVLFIIVLFMYFPKIYHLGYIIDYFENKKDDFIERYHSEIWDRDSFFFEFNYLAGNELIKERICRKFDSLSELPFPYDCWKDKNKFEELKIEFYKMKRLRLISEIENILRRQSARDLDELPLYFSTNGSFNPNRGFVKINKSSIKKGNYFLLYDDKDGDMREPVWILTKSNIHHYYNIESDYWIKGKDGKLSVDREKASIWSNKLSEIQFRIRYERFFETFGRGMDQPPLNEKAVELYSPKEIYRDSFSKIDRDKYQLACTIFSSISINLCYHEVYYVELGKIGIQILKFKNIPIEDNVFPNSIYKKSEDFFRKLHKDKESNELLPKPTQSS